MIRTETDEAALSARGVYQLTLALRLSEGLGSCASRETMKV